MPQLEGYESCPLCKGLGRRVLPHTLKAEPKCDLCQGHGWLPREVCRGCGRPAWKSDPVDYCGAKECFEALVHVRKSIEPEPIVIAGFMDRRDPWSGHYYD